MAHALPQPHPAPAAIVAERSLAEELEDAPWQRPVKRPRTRVTHGRLQHTHDADNTEASDQEAFAPLGHPAPVVTHPAHTSAAATAAAPGAPGTPVTPRADAAAVAMPVASAAHDVTPVQAVPQPPGGDGLPLPAASPMMPSLAAADAGAVPWLTQDGWTALVQSTGAPDTLLKPPDDDHPNTSHAPDAGAAGAAVAPPQLHAPLARDAAAADGAAGGLAGAMPAEVEAPGSQLDAEPAEQEEAPGSGGGRKGGKAGRARVAREKVGKDTKINVRRPALPLAVPPPLCRFPRLCS